MGEKKLFYVEFGEPRVAGFMSLSFGSPALSPVYVVARDYNEAASKALAYAEFKRSSEPAQDVLTPDGSLRNMEKDDEEIKIRSISIASEDVVW